MRRPLKPFVTEYKGSARRGAPALREAVVSETSKSAAKPLDFAFPQETEDSYEAAMRAADALFAPQRPAPPTPVRTSEQTPRQIPALESAAVVAPSASPIAPDRPAGRILRVLDEPPLPDALALAALEVERAPKRRGRKPGSKNKPKPAIALSAAEETDDAATEVAPSPVAPRPTPPAQAAVRRVAALPAGAAPATGKGVKKFTWVKDRLRPGEDWKRRRLPKVCW